VFCLAYSSCEYPLLSDRACGKKLRPSTPDVRETLISFQSESKGKIRFCVFYTRISCALSHFGKMGIARASLGQAKRPLSPGSIAELHALRRITTDFLPVHHHRPRRVILRSAATKDPCTSPAVPPPPTSLEMSIPQPRYNPANSLITKNK
jgi:hypothetical protein